MLAPESCAAGSPGGVASRPSSPWKKQQYSASQRSRLLHCGDIGEPADCVSAWEGEMAKQKRATDMALRSAPAPRKSTGPSVKLDEGLSPLARVFAPTKSFDAARAESELRDLMGELSKLRERNPFGNTVKLLALELGKKLDAEKLELGSIEDLIQHISAEAY
jgi:hypothetical protein